MNHNCNIVTQPCRIPQFKSVLNWIIITSMLFLLSAIFIHEFLEYLQLIPERYYISPHDTDSGYWIIAFAGLVPYLLYVWRYTIPTSLYLYERTNNGNLKLNFIGHCVSNITTLVILLFALQLLGVPT